MIPNLPPIKGASLAYCLHYIQAANHKLWFPVPASQCQPGDPTCILTDAEYNWIADAFAEMDAVQTFLRQFLTK